MAIADQFAGRRLGLVNPALLDFAQAYPEVALEVFYADRHQTGATLDLSLLTSGVTITSGVPEPASWAMMVLGLGCVGGVLRRRKDRMATLVA